jgi:HlyD family secretion protein
VRLSAFNARTTPELSGVVETISADLVRDSQSGAGYYDVRITLPVTEVSRLGELQLVAGMPAEVFLETGSRTMLSYLFKPITDQLSRMFRER